MFEHLLINPQLDRDKSLKINSENGSEMQLFKQARKTEI